MILLIFGLSALITFLLIYPSKLIATKFKIIDKPDPTRKIHKKGTPYLGGLAILCGWVMVSLTFGSVRKSSIFVLIAVLICLLGTLDDIKSIHPAIRISVESLAAAGAWRFTDLYHEWPGIVGSLFCIIWIVGITNSANLLDNMDGSLTVATLIISAGLTADAYMLNQKFIFILGLSLVGALIGFLPFNWPPAKIFMGDGGSLLLGFIVSFLTLSLQVSFQDWISKFVIPPIFCVIFLFDTTLVVLHRTMTRRHVFSGAKDHVTHRLNNLGLKIYIVDLVVSIGALFGVIIASSVELKYLNATIALILVILVVVPMFISASLVRVDVPVGNSKFIKS